MSYDWMKSFRTVSLITVVSRVTGYIRDGALGLWIGPGPILDAFLVVTRIASMGRAFFAEGMVNALIPTLALEDNIESQKRLISAIALRVFAVLFVLCSFVSLNPLVILGVITPGFSLDNRMMYAAMLLSVMFWYLLQISMISLMNAMLNLRGKFALISFLPCILNLMLMLASWLVGCHAWGVINLAYAVIIAGFIQMLCIVIMLYRTLGSWQGAISWSHPGVKNLYQVLAGAFASTGAVQCSTLIDTILATSLNAGAVSWVYYSDRLVQLPLGILGVSMMTVLLPKLSQHHASDQGDDYVSTFCMGLECMLMFGMPVMLLLLMLGENVVSTLFGYGRFTMNDVYQTSICLRWMAIALPAIMVGKLIAASSFAKRNVRGLMQASIMGVLCNGIFAWSMRAELQQQAMAIGMLLGAWVNVIWLFYTSSPISSYTLWSYCRIGRWACIWSVWTLGLVVMNQFITITSDMGPMVRFISLGITCLPSVIFYLIASVYMWMPGWLTLKVRGEA